MEPSKGHKWFTAFYDRMNTSHEKSFLADVRRDLVGGLRGRILEIGVGTGANFPYYRAGAEVTAIEPDPYMLLRAERTAREATVPIELLQIPAEDLPFPDGGFDHVVSTLVMCSVRDPGRVLSEIRRVLKPEGQFGFYEHVRYQNTLGGLSQDVITPLWKQFGAGCHPNRDLVRALGEAGFEIRSSSLSKPTSAWSYMVFSRPHLRAVAVPAGVAGLGVGAAVRTGVE